MSYQDNGAKGVDNSFMYCALMGKEIRKTKRMCVSLNLRSLDNAL